MPLLRKKEFQTATLPEYLRDDEEVFYCEVTNEIFRDYEEFCQRVILVNSMVWSCAMTGKSNLTYAEALQSEEAARKSIQDFPVELRTPVLYLTSKTKRTSFTELTEDVFYFVKDRYFAGEIVESCFTENNWRESHVLQVIAPTVEQIEADSKINSTSPERLYRPGAHLYRYEIEQLDANDQDSSHVMIVEASQVRRRKGPYSKEKNRLFLKQFVEQNNNLMWVVKESIRKKYRLDTMRFDEIFDGPVPNFDTSKRVVRAMENNGKKIVRQETLAKYLKKSNYFGDSAANGKKFMAEMKRKEEEHKQRCAELKLKKAEEKLLEKQKRREENLKMSSYVKEWYRPREDLELEDQKKLPAPIPVVSKIPNKYFGDALMVIEFCKNFSTLLGTKDYFPGGLTLDLLERALTEKEVAGPLTDIVQMFLAALFNIQDEEAAENKASQTDINSDDVTDSVTVSDAIHLATLAYGWSVSFQGLPLSRLPLYPLTVTEILRLHLLSSGARLNESAVKWRYQQRGGYTCEDDPGLTLRIKHPHILKALSIHNINQLAIGDKIKILICLIDQMLTYAEVRDVIEEQLEKTRQQKSELRSLQAAEKRREQEFVSTRVKMKREAKETFNTNITAELDKLQNEADKKRHEFEVKTKKLVNSLSVQQVVLGSDRAYRKYIKIQSIPAFFVENIESNPGICLDKMVIQRPELVDAGHADTLMHVRKLLEECNGSDKENEHGIQNNTPIKINGIKNSISIKKEDEDEARELYMCTANVLTCPVHSEIGKPRWSFYFQKEDLTSLMNSLNKRGIRESELKQVLENEKEFLEDLISQTVPSKLNPAIEIKSEESEVTGKRERVVDKKIQNMYTKYEDPNLGYPSEMEFSEILHLTLIDNILQMEEKLAGGCLGQLQVKDRGVWREHLQKRKYDQIDKTLIKKENQLEKIKSEGKNSRPGTPDSVYKDPGRFLGATMDVDSDISDSDSDIVPLTTSNDQQVAVKALATALAQVAQGVEGKYLKKPLGHADSSNKRKEETDVIERWEQSLLSSTSYAQIFLHYSTLDNCIMWTRSILLKRCRVCHRYRDPHRMLFCDICKVGQHVYCLKPKLTVLPKEYTCKKCKPKEKPINPHVTRKTRKIFTEESDNEEMDQEDTQTNDSNESKDNITTVEVCEECGSGGHVVCCDFCPKVYHLECTHPPMRRVPRGEWKCHKCRRKNTNTSNYQNKDSVDPENPPGNSMMGEVAQRGGGFFNRRRCASKARNKIHGFIQSLQRRSVDSNSGDDTPIQRRSHRRTQEVKETSDVNDDDLPLHNALLQELLQEVMKHKDSWPFTRPVTKSEVPDYYDVITKPMDFGKIKYKLNMGEYKCDADVMEDCALVFDNCNTYNNSDAPVYKCGLRLLRFFEKRCQEIGLKIPENLMGDDGELETEEDGPSRPKKSRH